MNWSRYPPLYACKWLELMENSQLRHPQFGSPDFPSSTVSYTINPPSLKCSKDTRSSPETSYNVGSSSRSNPHATRVEIFASMIILCTWIKWNRFNFVRHRISSFTNSPVHPPPSIPPTNATPPPNPKLTHSVRCFEYVSRNSSSIPRIASKNSESPTLPSGNEISNGGRPCCCANSTTKPLKCRLKYGRWPMVVVSLSDGLINRRWTFHFSAEKPTIKWVIDRNSSTKSTFKIALPSEPSHHTHTHTRVQSI